MALSKSYYSIEGEILGERDGLGRRNYASDALGSVAGTTSTGSLTGSSVYSPYGRSGSVSSGFGWNGSSGYYTTGRTYASHYVRARHYDSRNGRWNTVDPLWPTQMPFLYVSDSPVSAVDSSGYLPDYTPCESEGIGWAFGPLRRGERESPALRFRRCQYGLEQQFDARARSSYAYIQPCPGGRREICEACAKISGLHIDCSHYPSCSDIPTDAQVRALQGALENALINSLLVPEGLENFDKRFDICYQICLKLSKGKLYPQWRRQTCKEICAKVQSGLCRKLGDKCLAMQGPRQKELCLSVYNALDCPPLEIQSGG